MVYIYFNPSFGFVEIEERRDRNVEMKRRILRPPICDLSQSDEKIRKVIYEALRGTLSPAMTIVGHGCEGMIRELEQTLREKPRIKKVLQDEKTSQEAFDIDESLAKKHEKLKTCLEGVCKRLLCLASSKETSSKTTNVNGRLCFRVYPKQDKEKVRLGAHVDHTLMTLLYSNCAGLEILDSEVCDSKVWNREKICSYGLPTVGSSDGPLFLREDQWTVVDMPWNRYPLLFTVGASWLSCDLDLVKVESPVLHRVVTNCNTERVSLPFLVDLVDSS